MSEPRFTPGPWCWEIGDDGGRYIRSKATGSLIATTEHPWMEDDEKDANTALVAAAPDLYDIAVLAQRMRETQKRYFKTHDRAVLAESLALEKQLDSQLKTTLDRVHGVPTQGALLGGDA